MRETQHSIPKPIRPAASLLVIRDTLRGVQVLVIKRSHQLRFLPGYLSFPGGALDAGDVDVAAFCGTGSIAASTATDDFIYEVAAIRECAEEVGWLCAVSHSATQSALAGLTQEEHDRLLSGKVSFRDLLVQRGLRLDASQMRFVGRWVTPPHMPARFDTRFFLYVCRTDAPETRLNPAEAEWARWCSAAELLDVIRSGQELAVPPTIAMLGALKEASSCDEAMRSLSVMGP